MATVASHMSVRVVDSWDTQLRYSGCAQGADRAKHEDRCSNGCDPDLQMNPRCPQPLWESEPNQQKE